VIETKNRKERKVPVAGVLRLYLLEHKARTGRRDNDLMFGRPRTEASQPTIVRRRALKAWKAENDRRVEQERMDLLVPIGLHELRHTYVSLMFPAGCSLEEIGDYVGHSSTTMTNVYRHLLEGQREKAAERLDAFLAGAHSGAQKAGTA